MDVALLLIVAIQMESSSIWLIWIGLTALLLLLPRLLPAAELLADPPGCSSKLKAECVLWWPSLFRPALVVVESPDRGLLSGCTPELSKVVWIVRSVDAPDHDGFGWLLEPPLLRASLGLRNVAVDGRNGAEPAVVDVPGEYGFRGAARDCFLLARCSSSSTRMSGRSS